MRSASCYTNLRKTVAYAKNKKVNYPGGVAKNWETLQAALPCNPDFTVQNYVAVPIYCRKTNGCGVPILSDPVSSFILYSGGSAGTESTTLLTGGSVGTEFSSLLSGGSTSTESSAILTGGNIGTQSAKVLSGGNKGSELSTIISGGINFSVILSGGNA